MTWNVEAPYETGFVFSSVDGVSTLYRTRVLSMSMRGEDDLFIVMWRLGNCNTKQVVKNVWRPFCCWMQATECAVMPLDKN